MAEHVRRIRGLVDRHGVPAGQLRGRGVPLAELQGVERLLDGRGQLVGLRQRERQGLQLVKSRRRDPRALGYGLYMIIEAGEPASDLDDYTLDLNAVERSLTEK